MSKTLEELQQIITNAPAQLLAIDAAEATSRPKAGEWSKKEILGHLIDSALNNHQRFVRLQVEDKPTLPGYEQDNWVSLQDYQGREWEEVIGLWHAVNLHLLHIISKIPAENLQREGVIGDGAPVTLGFLVDDYLVHLKHHLNEILPQKK